MGSGKRREGANGEGRRIEQGNQVRKKWDGVGWGGVGAVIAVSFGRDGCPQITSIFATIAAHRNPNSTSAAIPHEDPIAAPLLFTWFTYT